MGQVVRISFSIFKYRECTVNLLLLYLSQHSSRIGLNLKGHPIMSRRSTRDQPDGTGKTIEFDFFKLADRMRSMRTNGASRNRDSSPPHLSFFRILTFLELFSFFQVLLVLELFLGSLRASRAIKKLRWTTKTTKSNLGFQKLRSFACYACDRRA